MGRHEEWSLPVIEQYGGKWPWGRVESKKRSISHYSTIKGEVIAISCLVCAGCLKMSVEYADIYNLLLLL